MNKRLFTVAVSLIAFVLFTILIGFNDRSFAQNQTENLSKEDDLSKLTVKIASLTTKLRQDNFSEKNSIAALAEKRYAKLADLIETDAAEVLRVALPADVLPKIPSDLENYFEKREETEGELEVIAACEENDGRILYYLNNGKERLKLQFAKQPEELLTGARVSVNGNRVGDTIAVNYQENTSDVQVLNAPLPNTFGEQKVLVLLVNFQDNQTQPFTIAQADDVIFNAANSLSVTNYYREASYQQTWLTGNSYGWFTLPISGGTCDFRQIATNAQQAATNAGINLSVYNKYVYVYPNIAACGSSGNAELGGDEAWINGSLALRTITHELGHTYGLYHSRALDCDGVVIGSNCVTVEYGNMGDIMGATRGHFHAFQKERLGWLNYGASPPVTTVQTSGTYFIAPLASGDSQPKALKILKSTDSGGQRTWYYLEFRGSIGFDNFLSTYTNGNLTSGIFITRNEESVPRENYQLDMTPETQTWIDSALVVNRSYTDSSAGLTITPLSVGNNGATVNISFGNTPPPCVSANPTMVISPAGTRWTGAGSSISYNLTVTNNNTSNCTNNNFNLQSNVPSGWSATFSSSSLNISPGASATATLQVASPSSVPDGFYSVGVGANNSSNLNYAASQTLTCAIASYLGVNVSTNQTNYTRGQTVVAGSVVTANGSPVSGANVTFTITKPGNTTVTGNAVTAADGSASFSNIINRKRDPLGTYTVNVNASFNGITGSGSSSFLVR